MPYVTPIASMIPPSVWQQDWVVHCQPVGNGRKAFQYLAPYIFCVAIGNGRLVSADNDQVTFRYRDSNTGQPKLCTLDAEEFIRRFLQHVLPKSFVKVRYYGFLSSGCRPQLALIREQLAPVETEPAKPIAVEQTLVAQPAPPVSPLGETLETDTATSLPEAIDTELDDALAPADDPQPEPDATTSAVPRCPCCGCPMRRRGSLPPKGRSPP